MKTHQNGMSVIALLSICTVLRIQDLVGALRCYNSSHCYAKTFSGGQNPSESGKLSEVWHR
jgi:hypothetical protein